MSADAQSTAQTPEERHALERDEAIRQRLPLTIALFLLLVGSAATVELLARPHRGSALALTYGADIVASLLAVLAIRMGGMRPHTRAVALGLAVVWSLALTTFQWLTGGTAERQATAQVCLLSGLVVMLPWGGRPQLVVGFVAMAGSVALGFHSRSPDDFIYGLVAALTATLTSVTGARFMDRQRFEQRRAAFALAEAKYRAEEAADIAAALQRVGETLNAHLGEPDMLARVTRLAVDAVGCDWGATFLWSDEQRRYDLVAHHGLRPDVAEELRGFAFTPDSLAIVTAHRPGAVLEIEDGQTQTLVPPELLARWDVASELCAPISRQEQLTGLLCVGYRSRTGAFSTRQHRLALGIAHATAVALENARLILDLQAANRLKTEFVSTMSHELRTPLNVILGFADIARDASVTLAERNDCLTRIDLAGRQLLTLVESTLEVGRLEAGRSEAVLEPFEMATFWAALGDDLAQVPRAPGVALVWRPATETTVVSDPRKLSIIVRNLVGNAVKFTTHGAVTACIDADDDHLVIRVADTGVGIAPEHHELIFELFRQSDGSDSRRFDGTGLGLYIVRRYAELLGGTVRVASVLGAGAAFTVTLPRTLNHAAATAA